MEVRRALEGDDLSGLLDQLAPHRLNLDQVWVAEDEGIQGVLVMWDAGHSAVYCDELTVRPGAPWETGP